MTDRNIGIADSDLFSGENAHILDKMQNTVCIDEQLWGESTTHIYIALGEKYDAISFQLVMFSNRKIYFPSGKFLRWSFRKVNMST